MRAILGLCLGVMLVACAPVREQSQSYTAAPRGEAVTVGIGDQVIRVDRTENLPNALGGSDFFGRRRPRGFTELKYIGTDSRGNPRFRRIDIEMMSNQTSVTESGLSIGSRVTRPIEGRGSQTTVVGVQMQPGRVGVLPPEILEFSLDLSDSNYLTVHGRVIEVLDASRTLLRFRVHQQGTRSGGAAEDGIRLGTGQFGTDPSERNLPQNAPRNWNGMPSVRPPP